MIYIQAKDESNIADVLKTFFQAYLPGNFSVNEMIGERVNIRMSTDASQAAGFCFPDDTGKPTFYIGPVSLDDLEGGFKDDLNSGMAEQITKEEFEALVNFNKEN